MRRFELVDFLKGYSILSIMVFHYLSYLHLPTTVDNLINFGGTGVHLFILLSGFGLYYSYLKKPLSYPMFLKKRFTKVYVPYIFVVLISALISLFIPAFRNSLYALGGHIFLYKMFDESIMGSYGYQLWFISMILQFYLTFHLIVWLDSKFKNRFFLIIGYSISIAWATLVFIVNKENERVWNSFFLQYFWEFALGMVLAEEVRKNKKFVSFQANQYVVLSIGLISTAIYGGLALKAGDVGKLFNDVFALIGYSFIAYFIYNLHLKVINQTILFIGKISLSVYLLHILLLLILDELLENMESYYIVMISILIIAPISLLYQRLVNTFFKISKI